MACRNSPAKHSIAKKNTQYRLPKKVEPGSLPTHIVSQILDAIGVDLHHLGGEASIPLWSHPAIAKLAIDFYFERSAHRSKPGWQSVSYTQFRALFRRDYSLIEQVKIIFEGDDDYSKARGTTKAYRLDREQRRNLNGLFSDLSIERSELVDLAGQSLKIPICHAHPKQPGQTLPNIPPECPVNTAALEQGRQAMNDWVAYFRKGGVRPNSLRREIEEKHETLIHTHPNSWKSELIKHLRAVLAEIALILSMARSFSTNGDRLPQVFLQSDAGRWYAKGAINLQGCRRLTRSIAMHGYWNYDFSMCHHAILLSVAGKADIECPELKRYAQDSRAYRNEVGRELRVSFAQVKEALIALIYGARLQSGGDLEQILGTSALRRARKHDSLCAKLSKEIRRISSAWLSEAIATSGQHSDSFDATGPINAAGLSMPMTPGKSSPRHILAHLLQGLESRMLFIALKMHNSAVLPLHDGWVTLNQENSKQVELAVLAETGIPVQVTIERFVLEGLID